MLRKILLRYSRTAVLCHHVLIHHYRHCHSYLSVKQALETNPSYNFPVLIQV